MIENKKTELVEEEEVSEQDNRRFLRIGFIVIGTIIVLMVACLIAIFILEN